MAGPSQPEVTDEVWDDDRVKSFLALSPRNDESADFHVLLKAYRGMRPDDFRRFLEYFIADGRNLEAADNKGRTLWDIISTHRHGAEFLNIKDTLAK